MGPPAGSAELAVRRSWQSALHHERRNAAGASDGKRRLDRADGLWRNRDDDDQHVQRRRQLDAGKGWQFRRTPARQSAEDRRRSAEQTSELQSLLPITYDV